MGVAFYLCAPRPSKELFFLSSPRYLYLAAPRGIYLSSPKFYIACPTYRDEHSKKVWRSEIQSRVKSLDSYAGKFLKDVEELTKETSELKKKADAYTKEFEARVKAREICIWGSKEALKED